jgi:hypothetical protein
MRKMIVIGLIFAICLMLAACSANHDITPIEPEPQTDILQAVSNPPSPSQVASPATPVEETENAQPLDYWNFVGIWRGYAMATFYTLVITDVIEEKMTFLFVHPLHLCAMGGGQSFASPVYTMPIIDNQITLSENRTLTFYENYIILRISSSDGNHEWQWNLRRISN